MNDNTGNEYQEFDLEDILKEFGDDSREEAPAQEPELQSSPEPAREQPLSEPAVTEPQPEPAALDARQQETAEPEEASDDPDPAGDAVPEGDTIRFDPAAAEQAAQSQTDGAGAQEPEQMTQNQSAQELPADRLKPAFEVEEEFIPAPSLFTSRSRLKELKKKLVSGPEKRYYELSEQGTGRLQVALLVTALIAALGAGILGMSAMELIPDNRLKLVIFSQILFMMISALMGVQLMIDSVADIFKGRFTVNALVTLTFIACMADGAMCLRELRVPCCAAFSLEMAMALWGRLQHRNTELGQLDTMRKAVRLTGIRRVKNYCDGKDGFLRGEGQVEDFMDSYDKQSGPQVIQSIYAGIAFAACAAIAVVAGLRSGFSVALQIFSTSLLVAVPATFFVSLTRPMAILETRLHMVGTVLCGWQGVKGLKGKAFFPVFDQDLFPQGSTKINGVKFYGDEDPIDVVSYTASLLSAAGGGLTTVFKNLMDNRGGQLQTVESFQRYVGGGIGGEIHGMPVLLGSMQFLEDMGVAIPEGTMVSQAVYVAIDGELAAVYAISYAKMRSAAAGLVALCGFRKVTPVMLCGDFMLTEDFLRAKFNVRTKRVLFPQKEQRSQMSKAEPDPQAPVLAITTRPELVSSAYAITGAGALRTACTLGLAIHILGGILGVLIMLALAVIGNTDLLTPTNVLLYQLIWGVPGLLVTEWTRVL